MRDLPALLDQLEQADGPADPVPSADGWELVLAENVVAPAIPPFAAIIANATSAADRRRP